MEHQDSVYRNVMWKALDFAWHHKRLWFLGVFAGLVNSGGVFEVIVRGARDVIGSNIDTSSIADMVAPGGSVLTLLPDMITLNNLTTLEAVLVWIVMIGIVGLAFWFFSLSQGSLIAAVRSPGDVSITQRTHDELPLAGKLMTLNLGTHIALAIVMVLSVLPYTYAQGEIGKALATLLGFLFASAATIAITLFSLLGACGIALHRESLMSAAKKAIKILKRDTLMLLEAALFYFLLAVGFVMLLGIALKLLALVFMTYGVLTFIFSAEGLVLFLSYAFLAISILVILAGFGFLVTFQYAAWANLYEVLVAGGARAAFHRYLVHPLKLKFAK